MITVQVSTDGYFTGSYAKVGSIPNGIKVATLPEDLTNSKTTCWKYGEYQVDVEIQVPVQGEAIQVPVIDEETQEQKVDELGELVFETQEGAITYETQIVKEPRIGWIFDEEKYARILAEIEAYIPPKTQGEINEEIIAKNATLESAIDELMTSIIPELMGMNGIGE